MEKDRVVITGLGAVTPIGNNVDEFWKSAKLGKCGIDYIKTFDVEKSKVKLAAQVKGFDTGQHFSAKQLIRLDRFSQLAIVASREAYIDAGLDSMNMDKYRLGVIMGNGVGGVTTFEEEANNLINDGMRGVSPLLMPKFIPNIATANIAIELKAKGIVNTIITACASGTNAIGEAYRAILCGDADVVITGGSEACITSLVLAGFTNLNALSTSNDPYRASRPFDNDRDGFVMGEGAGMMILEKLEHAKNRGAKIYAEVVGYGTTCDAYHLTASTVEGEARAMELAIRNASINPNDLSYINAHGTSTQINDKTETKAIKKVFGDYAKNIPISSTKSMIGHLLGAAGAVEAIACIKSIQENCIHGTIGYKNKDAECDLDYVVEGCRDLELNYVLSNSFGFGGHNASIIFKRYIK
ncbi:beta-ketoacyl-ACP synthase II [Clostridiaceae bacterium M8S5]|nr:beta-ketoacyl-ACP synthase II [Clostridiaceae bacterium M8S5]